MGYAQKTRRWRTEYKLKRIACLPFSFLFWTNKMMHINRVIPPLLYFLRTTGYVYNFQLLRPFVFSTNYYRLCRDFSMNVYAIIANLLVIMPIS